MIWKEERVKQLQALANPGADELVYLGECHYYGEGGVEENPSKAFQLFQQAVALDPSNGKALYWLGACYGGGQGTGEDGAQARRLMAEAFRQLQQQAETVPNDAYTQLMLALCYLYGDGVTCDMAKAVVWCKQAAMQGHAEAQVRLGHCLRNGWGVAIDKVEAGCWYAQAARQGYSGANDRLVVLLQRNVGLLNELTDRANKNRNDFVAYARSNLVFLFQDTDSVLDELTKRAKTNRNDYLAASALAYIYDKGVVVLRFEHENPHIPHTGILYNNARKIVAANAERASHWKQRAEQCSESIPAEWLPTCLRPTSQQ